jgi:hypothetical protein
MQSRVAVRTAFILVFTAFSVIVMGLDFMLPWRSMWTFGVAVDSSKSVISAGPAAVNAGLHVGDRLIFERVPPFGRHALVSYTWGPKTETVQTTSGKTIVLHSFPEVRSPSDNWSDLIAVFTQIVYILIAAGLVLLRPTPATWAFYGFSYVFCLFGKVANGFPPVPQVFGVLLVLPFASAISPVAFVLFALRFPDVRLRGALLTFERILLFGIVPLLFVLFWIPQYTFIFTDGTAPAWMGPMSGNLSDVLYIVGVGILVARYLTANAQNRNRLQWVVAAFSVAYLPFLGLILLWRDTNAIPSDTLINLSLAWQVLVPIALAYTVLKHRLFDIRFIVSRTLVYAVMVSVSIAVLALVDWAFGKWLEQSRFAIPAELGLALLLGASLTMLHRRIEHVLNSVIFRAQALALQGLRRFSHETDLIADSQRLLSQTYEALECRIECEYVAIYTEEGSSYALTTPHGGPAPTVLAGDDFAVLRLRRWHEAYECDEPRHVFRSALLLPMTARGRLVGFVVCGPKRDRTHYLPEEVETLSGLAHRVGSAYALLTIASGSMLLQAPST